MRNSLSRSLSARVAVVCLAASTFGLLPAGPASAASRHVDRKPIPRRGNAAENYQDPIAQPPNENCTAQHSSSMGGGSPAVCRAMEATNELDMNTLFP